MSKILITGATGFAGGALAQRLAAQGYNLVAFVRSTSDTEALTSAGVQCCVVDITDAADVHDNFYGIQTVYHIASAYRTEHVDHAAFRRVNVDATRNLLEAAKQHGVTRFVHCSTVGVQGAIEDPPADENYRTRPVDHYQQSKLDGELLARRYFADGLPGTVVRPVGIYGPGDTRFLKLFKAIASGWFVMIGNGNVLYHMTYIDDLIDGFLAAGEHPEALGEVFTIAGPEYTTINTLVELIAQVSGKTPPRLRVPFAPVYAAAWLCDRACRTLNIAPPLYPRRVEFFQHDRAFSTAKAEALLGYRPKVSLAEGIERTYRWYLESGYLAKDHSQGRARALPNSDGKHGRE